MYSNVHHLKILELYSPYTVETTPKKYGPYTFCTGTMRSICRNYPLNLKQLYGNFHYFFYCRLFMTEIEMVISFNMLNSSLLTFLQHFFLFLRNTQNEFYYFILQFNNSVISLYRLFKHTKIVNNCQILLVCFPI